MSVIQLQLPNDESRPSEYRYNPALDTDLLRTLVAISDTGSFNRAARQVFRTPSAVSMQMKKLEDQVGRPLFAKDGRSVTLTPDGEALVGYGRRIIKLSEEAMQRFRAPAIEGTIKLGTPDDYAARFLPGILARFAASHPNVEVDVCCESTRELVKHLDDGSLDISLLSNGHGQPPGQVVRREELVWVGLRHGCAHESDPIPLALSHVGCCWRMQALDALNRAGIPHRIAYTSRHYLGQLAAVLGGLAIAPLPRSSVTGDLRVLTEDTGLPPIGFFEIELKRSHAAHGPLFDALADHIETNFRSTDVVAA